MRKYALASACLKTACYLTRACLSERLFSGLHFLSEGKHHAESPWTVTRLQECDLAMSWLPSSQSQGATWGLNQTQTHKARQINWDLLKVSCVFAPLWALNGWEELLNGQVRNPIMVSEMRCTICENRPTESPFQLLESLSCDKEEEGSRASCLRL